MFSALRWFKAPELLENSTGTANDAKLAWAEVREAVAANERPRCGKRIWATNKKIKDIANKKRELLIIIWLPEISFFLCF